MGRILLQTIGVAALFAVPLLLLVELGELKILAVSERDQLDLSDALLHSYPYYWTLLLIIQLSVSGCIYLMRRRQVPGVEIVLAFVVFCVLSFPLLMMNYQRDELLLGR